MATNKLEWCQYALPGNPHSDTIDYKEETIFQHMTKSGNNRFKGTKIKIKRSGETIVAMQVMVGNRNGYHNSQYLSMFIEDWEKAAWAIVQACRRYRKEKPPKGKGESRE